MKSTLVFAALSASVLASGIVRADADPCLDALDPVTVSYSSFVSSSLQTRLQTLCELRDAVINQYSLYDLKQERIKNADGSAFNSLAYLNQCIANEKLVTNDDSDLHFIDRVSQCIAGFHDTHFWVSAPVAVPPVFAGLMVRDIGGKYYISEIMEEVLGYVNAVSTGSDSLKAAMVPGNQLLEIDGQSPADVANQYAAYISGSSPDFIHEQAVQSLFYRTFSYPTKNAVEVKIQDAKNNVYTLQLPWWGGVGAHTREDANAYFSKLGIPLSDRVKMVMNEDLGLPDFRSVGLNLTGYDDSKSLFPGDAFNPVVEYSDDSGAPGLRVAEVVAPGQPSFCYMELLTFGTANFKGPGANTKPASFGDTIRGFVENCKAKNLDLVLDLRSNPGGNGDFPDLLLSILTDPGKTYPAPVVAFRVTQDTERLLSSDNFVPEVAFKDLGTISMNPLDVFNAAVSASQPETDIIPGVALGVDSAVGGYNGNILALVTPDCISACDMTASLLKKSGRALLLGSHSNGTGAGFESSSSLDSTFKDQNDELAIKIPNFMFGVPDKLLDQSKAVSYAQFKDSYLLENNPTVADLQYSVTTDDLDATDPGQGWRAAVLMVMKTASEPVAATPQASASPAPSSAAEAKN